MGIKRVSETVRMSSSCCCQLLLLHASTTCDACGPFLVEGAVHFSCCIQLQLLSPYTCLASLSGSELAKRMG